MKIPVTGATSGLGRNAVHYLLERGFSVVATGRNQVEGAHLKHVGATFIPLDLSPHLWTNAPAHGGVRCRVALRSEIFSLGREGRFLAG